MEDIDALRIGSLDSHSVHKLVQLRQTNTINKQIMKLPNFICSVNNFYMFSQENSVANYITKRRIAAEVIFIDNTKTKKIDGKIIAIPSADPGFDWLFSYDIKGLITQYGGANSHMAIRCAELNIPAAIGVGDKIYEYIEERQMILDCFTGKIEHV